jgi:PAS domain S-box-containing protein
VIDLGEVATRSEKAKLLDLVLEATNDGIMRLDLLTGRTYYSPRWQHLFGFEGDDLEELAATDVWRALVHPDDLPEMESLLNDHIHQGWPFATTVRMKHRHGGHRHILCRAATERDDAGGPHQVLMVFADITDRIRTEERQAAIARALPDTLMRLDANATIVEVIKGAERPGSPFAELEPRDPLPQCLEATPLRRHIGRILKQGSRISRTAPLPPIEVVTTQAKGMAIHHELRVFSCGSQEVLCIARDVTEQRGLEQQLAQAQKLQAVGHLAAGVAHEINTPMQFIGDNLHFIRSAIAELVPCVNLLRELISKAAESPLEPEDLARAASAESDADLEYTLETLPDVVERSLAGVERITKIVQAMKAFSHPGSPEFAPVDLGSLLDNTITVATSEWKYVADVELSVSDTLPLVKCMAGELNQVILNLIVNASHAISDVVGSTGEKGKIRIEAHEEDKAAVLSISDTGAGIPEAIRSKVFDPFFTTKGVGKGTGQGLALAHGCIVERHKGTIHFESEVGRGTTFIIRLPIDGGPAQNAQGEAA